MRDDLSAPNLGQAKREEYDAPFFWQSYRSIEQWMSRVLSKGPLNVSSLSADTFTLSGNLTVGGNISVTGNASVTGDVSVTGDLTVDDITADDIVSNSVATSSVTTPLVQTATGNSLQLSPSIRVGSGLTARVGTVTVKTKGAIAFPVTSPLNNESRFTGPVYFSAPTTYGGDLTPATTGIYNLGSAALRWNTVYTSDLSLNNGIGDWTIVEGEDDLFITNNRSGKRYKFALIEV